MDTLRQASPGIQEAYLVGSTVAKCVVGLLVILAFVAISDYQARWHRLKRELAIREVNEKKKEEIHRQREQLYRQQLDFFTNISHEFRTPLSLIVSPLETLIRQDNPADLDYQYQLMHRNTRRLVNLINELMNFRKVADSVIKLRVQRMPIDTFCRELVRDFQVLAACKGITFTTSTLPPAVGSTSNSTSAGSLSANSAPSEPLIGSFDIQVLEKILLNLLDNAFKYTPKGGSIQFDLFFDISRFVPAYTNGLALKNQGHRAEKYIYFRVSDTGIGISGESLPDIFNRYYRVGSSHLGSGIGLALVKSLTQLHKGDIYVYSGRQQGTEIIIGIPWGEENYTASERDLIGDSTEPRFEPTDYEFLCPPEPPQISQPEHSPTNPLAVPESSKKHILLVDDDDELRRFLRQCLNPKYHVYEAADGHEAAGIAAGNIPDLIISDVMMPGMSGIELCKQVKEQSETSHIPFIILSARDALETQLNSMGSGADYYFSKPLSVDLLRLTIDNIFGQAEKIRQRHDRDQWSATAGLAHSEKDKAFLREFIQLIEKNIQDPDLDVDFLCGKLFISRTRLYQKVQSISGQTVTEFIRSIRLKRAIHLMTHEDIPMNEVAYRIGLQSSSNFSRVFKKEYGMSPMQFLRSLKKN